MRHSAFLLLLLAACRSELPHPVCVTPGGLEMYSPEASCEALDAADRAIRHLFTRHAGLSPELLDRRLRGYQIRLHPQAEGGRWFSTHHRSWVAGLTYCSMSTIWVGDLDLTRWETRQVLAHEMAHAADLCATPEHQGWETNGFQAAISEFAGLN